MNINSKTNQNLMNLCSASILKGEGGCFPLGIWEKGFFHTGIDPHANRKIKNCMGEVD